MIGVLWLAGSVLTPSGLRHLSRIWYGRPLVVALLLLVASLVALVITPGTLTVVLAITSGTLFLSTLALFLAVTIRRAREFEARYIAETLALERLAENRRRNRGE